MAGTTGGSGASRRGLQILLAVSGLIPLSGGLLGMVRGAHATPPVPVMLDSDYRFLSTLLVGSALVLYWAIPRVERAAVPIRAVCAIGGGCLGLAGHAPIRRPVRQKSRAVLPRDPRQ